MSLFYCVDLNISATEDQIAKLSYSGEVIPIKKANDSKRRNPPSGMISIVNQDGSVSYEDEPEPTIEELQSVERNWRDSEMTSYIDYFQSKPLLWAELSEEEKTAVINYRILLKDYPDVEGFGDESLRPTRPESPSISSS